MLSVSVFAQESGRDRPPFSERLFYGGSFGLQLGTVTDIELDPVLGFWLLPRVAVAAGPDFQYFNVRGDATFIYGGRAYLQFVLIQDLNNVIPLGVNTGIFIQGEYDGLSLESEFFGITSPPKRQYMGTFLAGAGLSQQLGKRSFLNFTFLWALSDQKFDGIYGSPEIRILFLF